MATQPISDVLVGGQDLGTGLGDNVDPGSAGTMALYGARSGMSAFVVANYAEGLGFVSRNPANDTVTVGTGLCYIVDDATISPTATDGNTYRDGNVTVQSEKTGVKPWTYDHELAGNIVYPVEARTQTTVDVAAATSNQIWINIDDLTSNNSVEIRSDGGGGTTAEPSTAYLLLGDANPDDASADTRPNDFESPIFRALEVRGDLTDDQSNTIYDYSAQALGSTVEGNISHDNIGGVSANDHHQDPTAGSGLTDEGTNQFGLDSVANGDATLSSGTVTVDTGHAIDDTAEYTVMINPDEGADIAASLEEGGTNYQLHLEENTTSVGNPTCRWRLLRYN